MEAHIRRKNADAPAVADERRRRILSALPVSERRIDVAGVSTAVLEGGEGPPVVLLHGQGEFAATWMRVIPALADTHRVVVPDLPGHGESVVGGGKLDAPRVLDWLDGLIAQTCASPPVLAGHVLGGAIAMRFAIDRPDRLARLVLVDTFGLARFAPAPPFMLAMIGFVARPTDRSRDRLFRQCFTDLDAVRNDMNGAMELLEGYALECARRPRLQAALRSLMWHFGMKRIPRADLARNAVPTTLIWGRDDLQSPLRVARAASRDFGWPLHVVDGARDDPAVERPEAFLSAWRAALEEASPASS